MRKSKQIVSACLALVLTCCLSIPASAGFIASKELYGYGTLYGRILTSGGRYKTQVDRNTDQAVLYVTGELQGKSGLAFKNFGPVESTPGETLYNTAWSYVSTVPSDCVWYGTHGVKDGKQFAGGSVYTMAVIP